MSFGREESGEVGWASTRSNRVMHCWRVRVEVLRTDWRKGSVTISVMVIFAVRMTLTVGRDFGGRILAE